MLTRATALHFDKESGRKLVDILTYSRKLKLVLLVARLFLCGNGLKAASDSETIRHLFDVSEAHNNRSLTIKPGYSPFIVLL